jgi:nucleotide-binding universal stress UspA family protein
MYRHILVPTDGSPLSNRAARAAARLAGKHNARITALYSIEPFSPPTNGADAIAFSATYSPKEYEAGMRKVADKALAKVRAAAAAENVPFTGISVIQGHPWEAIVNAAKQKKCDLIVMASHGRRGLAGLLLGSETQKVLTHTRTPVLVCR